MFNNCTPCYLRPLLPDSPLLFPNRARNVFDHLSRKVSDVGAKYGLGIPTATEGRHTATTAAAQTCSDRDRDAVATAMSHSRGTQQRYYVNLKSEKEAVRGFEILEGLRQGQPSTPTRKQKVPYSAKELKLLELYFDSNIRRIGRCAISRGMQGVLENHTLQCTHKQIRDEILPTYHLPTYRSKKVPEQALYSITQLFTALCLRLHDCR
jgi:hypothetical protein